MCKCLIYLSFSRILLRVFTFELSKQFYRLLISVIYANCNYEYTKYFIFKYFNT